MVSLIGDLPDVRATHGKLFRDIRVGHIMRLFASLITILLSFQVHAAQAATVTPYAGVGTQSIDYVVTAGGQNVPVNVWSYGNGTVQYAHFEFAGAVTVEITRKHGNIGPTNISPKRFSIVPTISGNKATFALSTPRQLVVYTEGTRIFIFAEGPETTPSQSNLLPGTLWAVEQEPHLAFAGEIAPTSANAPLTFMSNPLSGVRMVGRGNYEKWGTIELYNLENFRMEGVVIRNKADNAWAMIPRYLVNAVFSNIKVLTQYGGMGRDGIDLDNSSNVLIENSFIFSGDDSICLKAMSYRFPFGPPPHYGVHQPPVPIHDIHVRDTVLISGWNAMQMGDEIDADAYNIWYQNIDVLEAYSGISLAGVKTVRNIHYNNVRIENTWSNYFMHLDGLYLAKPGSLHVDNLVVDQAKGIKAFSGREKLDVYFKDLTVAGRRITSLDDLRKVAGIEKIDVSGNIDLHFGDSASAPLD